MNAETSPAAVRVRIRNFSRSLPMTLLTAREAVMSGFQSVLRRADLTEQQWRVLYILGFEREIEATALAEATCLLPPSLSRILRDLEARGLVTRHPAPEDRRRSLVSASAAGRETAATIAPEIEAVHAALVERFGHDRMEELQRLLKMLDDTVEHANGKNLTR